MTENIKEQLTALKKLQPKPTALERNLLKQSAGGAYAAKKLTDAIETLTIGTGNVRTRLLEASAFFPGIKREDFPESQQKNWDMVLMTVARFEPLFKVPSRAEFFRNSPKNATRGMKNITAQRAAKLLVELYWSVTKNQRYL